MFKKLYFFLFVMVGIICVSCGSKWDAELILGDWKTFQWTQTDSGTTINNKLSFHFDKDGRYSIDYGSEVEEGKYWLAGEYLHTVEDGRAEIKVKILELSSDTLVMEMNRSGMIERLSMVRSE